MRAPYFLPYGQKIVDPPGLTWYVAADASSGEILAATALGPSLFVGVDESAPTVYSMYDLYGKNLGATSALSDKIFAYADRMGWDLTVWMPLDRPSRIQYALQKGFVQVSVLLRRSAQSQEDAV